MTSNAALPAVEDLVRDLGLLPAGHVSRLHRIEADEGWHHYLGGALDVYELDESQPGAACCLPGSQRLRNS